MGEKYAVPININPNRGRNMKQIKADFNKHLQGHVLSKTRLR